MVDFAVLYNRVVLKICCAESFWHTLNIEIILHSIKASHEPTHERTYFDTTKARISWLIKTVLSCLNSLQVLKF